MLTNTKHYMRVAKLDDVQAAGCLVVPIEGYTLASISRDDQICAIDNRCPHVGFPLDRGTVKDGILTCHWHHARFRLREDRDFHMIQVIEATFRQYELLRETPTGTYLLVAAVRYLAAHSPTMRSQGQTYQMAVRLHRGDCLFEETEPNDSHLRKH